MSKAQVSIAAFIYIVITVVAVGLAVALAFQSSKGRAFFCSSVDGLGLDRATMLASYCNGSRLYSELPSRKEFVVDVFGQHTSVKFFSLNDANGLKGATTVVIPGDALVSSASFFVDSSMTGGVSKFSDDSSQKRFNFGFNGGLFDASVKVPGNVRIISSSLSVSGSNVPSSADLVMILDTSISMREEWSSLCRVIPLVESELKARGIDVKTTVYRLAGGRTYDFCGQSAISESDLGSVLPSGVVMRGQEFSRDSSGTVWTSPPYDDFSEAWALGVLWAVSRHPWRPNTKKVVFPISDSDPTGGGQVRAVGELGKDAVVEGDAEFTGNEAVVVDAAVSSAKDASVYVFPVYGDDPRTDAPPEGYNVGVPLEECRSRYGNTCGRVIGWMEQVASSTRGKVVGYRDETLAQAILDSIRTEYPKDVAVYVAGRKVFSVPVLDSSNSPKVVGFASELQSALSSCSGSDAFCEVPLGFESKGEGTLIASDLRVRFAYVAEGVRILLRDREIFRSERVAGPEKVVFSSMLEELHRDCGQGGQGGQGCEYELSVSSSKPSKLVFRDLSVRLKSYGLYDELIDMVYMCSRSSKDSGSDSDCGVLGIPSDYGFRQAFSEEAFAERVKERRLCHVVPVSDFGCGSSDVVDFSSSFSSPTNLLVRYSSSSKKVVVS
ncbi:hypothetical protein HY640_04690 [Candidatus Woesearchaeota archaeon]|nr:hypothetical protein [Candidatus Woesearchaeota archaeon]